MAIMYEVYYQSDKYDEYIYYRTNSKQIARQRYNHCLNIPAPRACCTRSNLLGECIGAEEIKFTGKPGLDVWMTWTDSHGHPAKRLLKVLHEAEQKSEVLSQSVGLQEYDGELPY